jgi:hydrogenase expression/formation protein HypC
MCIGVPMRIASVEPDHGTAVASGRGRTETINVLLVETVAPGDWVLAFQGSAIRTLSPDEARETDAALDALQSVLDGTGSIDSFFPDLADREPQLPAHLKGNAS